MVYCRGLVSLTYLRHAITCAVAKQNNAAMICTFLFSL